MKYFLVLTLALFAFSRAQLQLKKLRLRLKGLQCEPVEGHEDDIVPCYDLKTGAWAKAEECGKGPKFIHCCQYDCKCIIKGAGNPKNAIPDKFTPDTAKDPSARKAAFREQIFEDCVIETTPGSALAANVTNATQGAGAEGKVVATTAPLSITKEPTTAASKSTPKATKKTKVSKKPRKPGRRPTTKKPKKPKPSRKTTTTEKPPCTTTEDPQNSFSFNFFKSLSRIISGFGFESEVVPNC